MSQERLEAAAKQLQKSVEQVDTSNRLSKSEWDASDEAALEDIRLKMKELKGLHAEKQTALGVQHEITVPRRLRKKLAMLRRNEEKLMTKQQVTTGTGVECLVNEDTVMDFEQSISKLSLNTRSAGIITIYNKKEEFQALEVKEQTALSLRDQRELEKSGAREIIRIKMEEPEKQQDEKQFAHAHHHVKVGRKLKARRKKRGNGKKGKKANRVAKRGMDIEYLLEEDTERDDDPSVYPSVKGAGVSGANAICIKTEEPQGHQVEQKTVPQAQYRGDIRGTPGELGFTSTKVEGLQDGNRTHLSTDLQDEIHRRLKSRRGKRAKKAKREIQGLTDTAMSKEPKDFDRSDARRPSKRARKELGQKRKGTERGHSLFSTPARKQPRSANIPRRHNEWEDMNTVPKPTINIIQTRSKTAPARRLDLEMSQRMAGLAM